MYLGIAWLVLPGATGRERILAVTDKHTPEAAAASGYMP